MTLGERIKGYRTENNMSQDAFAEKLNVSRQAITKWENDKGIPDVDNLIRLSEMMGITTDELITGKRGENTDQVIETALEQRSEKKKYRMVAMIGLGTAALCWIVSMIINLYHDNDLAAVVNGITICLDFVALGLLYKRYREET